jgi:hypothetical protein
VQLLHGANAIEQNVQFGVGVHPQRIKGVGGHAVQDFLVDLKGGLVIDLDAHRLFRSRLASVRSS